VFIVHGGLDQGLSTPNSVRCVNYIFTIAKRQQLLVGYVTMGLSLKKTVQYRIKLLLNKRKLTPYMLAQRLGVSPQAVYKMLGDEGNPQLDVIEKIAKILDVEPHKLFEP
jgi:DNA-binding XRE family transcriptional regulator